MVCAKPIAWSIVVCVGALLLGACGGGSNSSNTATLNMGLTDAPAGLAGVTQVNIAVTGVQLQPANGAPITIPLTDSSGNAVTQVINLLDYQKGTVFPLVNNVAVPAVQYQWVRLMLDTTTVVNGANTVVVAGSTTPTTPTTYDLKIPSGAETGLKLVQGIVLDGRGVSNFVLDFKVAESLVPVANSSSWILKPVLHIMDMNNVGSIAGTIHNSTIAQVSAPASACSSSNPPWVYVYFGQGNFTPDDINTGPDVAEAAGAAPPFAEQQAVWNGTNGDATFNIQWLPPGVYTVAFTCDLDDPSQDESAMFNTSTPPVPMINFIVISPRPNGTVVSSGQTASITYSLTTPTG